MAEVLLFHHAQGLTEGVVAFADELRAAGHVVVTPDLYDGRTFPSLSAAWPTRRSWASARSSRAGNAPPRAATRSCSASRSACCPAQRLAQAGAGAGAVFIAAAIPLTEFGGTWPEGLPLQLHSPDPDEDVEIARELAATIAGAELFLYPGADHLFLDRSLAGYDEEATALLTRRVLDFLAAR